MTIATLTLAEQLKVPERQTVAEDATLRARWGTNAGDTTQSSPLTREADAITEAARQLTQLGVAYVDDIVTLLGVQWSQEGETVLVEYNGRLGLAGTQPLLVTRSQVDIASNTTVLQGLVVLP